MHASEGQGQYKVLVVNKPEEWQPNITSGSGFKIILTSMRDSSKVLKDEANKSTFENKRNYVYDILDDTICDLPFKTLEIYRTAKRKGEIHTVNFRIHI